MGIIDKLRVLFSAVWVWVMALFSRSSTPPPPPPPTSGTCRRPAQIPDGYDFTNAVDVNLTRSSEFNVTGIECATTRAATWSGRASATICDVDGGEYNLAGCSLTNPKNCADDFNGDCSASPNNIAVDPSSAPCSGDACTVQECCITCRPGNTSGSCQDAGSQGNALDSGLPSDWTTNIDPSTGATSWSNTMTGAVQNTPPPSIQSCTSDADCQAGTCINQTCIVDQNCLGRFKACGPIPNPEPREWARHPTVLKRTYQITKSKTGSGVGCPYANGDTIDCNNDCSSYNSDNASERYQETCLREMGTDAEEASAPTICTLTSSGDGASGSCTKSPQSHGTCHYVPKIKESIHTVGGVVGKCRAKIETIGWGGERDGTESRPIVRGTYSNLTSTAEFGYDVFITANGESCTSTLLSDNSITPNDTTNCHLRSKNELFVTDRGTCSDKDSAIATCEYVQEAGATFTQLNCEMRPGGLAQTESDCNGVTESVLTGGPRTLAPRADNIYAATTYTNAPWVQHERQGCEWVAGDSASAQCDTGTGGTGPCEFKGPENGTGIYSDLPVCSQDAPCPQAAIGNLSEQTECDIGIGKCRIIQRCSVMGNQCDTGAGEICDSDGICRVPATANVCKNKLTAPVARQEATPHKCVGDIDTSHSPIGADGNVRAMDGPINCTGNTQPISDYNTHECGAGQCAETECCEARPTSIMINVGDDLNDIFSESQAYGWPSATGWVNTALNPLQGARANEVKSGLSREHATSPYVGDDVTRYRDPLVIPSDHNFVGADAASISLVFPKFIPCTSASHRNGDTYNRHIPCPSGGGYASLDWGKPLFAINGPTLIDPNAGDPPPTISCTLQTAGMTQINPDSQSAMPGNILGHTGQYNSAIADYDGGTYLPQEPLVFDGIVGYKSNPIIPSLGRPVSIMETFNCRAPTPAEDAAVAAELRANSSDCAGTWDNLPTCDDDCKRPAGGTFTETTAQSGNGAACPPPPPCRVGDGSCGLNREWYPTTGLHTACRDVCAAEGRGCVGDPATPGGGVFERFETTADAAAAADLGRTGQTETTDERHLRRLVQFKAALENANTNAVANNKLWDITGETVDTVCPDDKIFETNAPGDPGADPNDNFNQAYYLGSHWTWGPGRYPEGDFERWCGYPGAPSSGYVAAQIGTADPVAMAQRSSCAPWDDRYTSGHSLEEWTVMGQPVSSVAELTTMSLTLPQIDEMDRYGQARKLCLCK